MSQSASLQQGLVVASHGRHVWVETADGQRLLCHPRSKKNLCVVGDQVQWLPSADEGSIEAVRERRNLFYRQDDIRTKSFAANIDQILVLIAAQPEFSEHQLARGARQAVALGDDLDLAAEHQRQVGDTHPHRAALRAQHLGRHEGLVFEHEVTGFDARQIEQIVNQGLQRTGGGADGGERLGQAWR